MPARYWSCRKCGYRNERTHLLCRGWIAGRDDGAACTGRRPKAHVPKHAIVMRDNGYQHFRDVNEAIHGAGDNCGVCGAVPKDSRNMQREHDHVTGQARGLACWRCNRLMPKQFDLATARRIVAYLERVTAYYGETPCEFGYVGDEREGCLCMACLPIQQTDGFDATPAAHYVREAEQE